MPLSPEDQALLGELSQDFSLFASTPAPAKTVAAPAPELDLDAIADDLWTDAAARADSVRMKLTAAQEAAKEPLPTQPVMGEDPESFYTRMRGQSELRQQTVAAAQKEADDADEFERSVRTPKWARQYVPWAIDQAKPSMLANKRYGRDYRQAREMLAGSKDPNDQVLLKAMELKDQSVAKYRQGMSKHYQAATKLLDVHDDRSALLERLRQIPANEHPLVLQAMDELLSESGYTDETRPGFGTRTSGSYRAGVKQVEDTTRRYFGDETPEEAETLRQITGLVQREFAPSRESDPWLDRQLQTTTQMAMPMAAMVAGGRVLGAGAKAAGAGKAVTGLAVGAGVTGAAFPLEYEEMMDTGAEAGISPQVMAQVAPWAALASAMVETILPDPWAPGSNALKGGVRKAVTRALADYAVRVGTESAEEGIQGGLKGAGEMVASILDENAPDQGLGQTFKRAWDDTTQSVVPMGILIGGPGVVGVPATAAKAKAYGEYRAQRKADLERIRPIIQRMREDAKQESETTRPDAAGVPGSGVPPAAGTGGATGTESGDVPPVPGGGPGTGPVADTGGEVDTDALLKQVLDDLRETVGHLDDTKKTLGPTVGPRAARDLAATEPPSRDIGKRQLAQWREAIKARGEDPDALLAGHMEYQDLLRRMDEYQGKGFSEAPPEGTRWAVDEKTVSEIDRRLAAGEAIKDIAAALNIGTEPVKARKMIGKRKKRLDGKTPPIVTEGEAEDYGSVDAPNRTSLGKHFHTQFSSGKAYRTINEARQEAGKLLKGQVKPGTPAAKHVDEAVEIGVTRAAKDIVSQGKAPKETFDALVDLYRRQPRLGVRTSTSIKEQAYSTPAPLAYLATHMVRAEGRQIYDSSAGNGMLLIGSDDVLANELNPERAAALQAQGIRTTVGDATTVLPDGKVDVVLINPPFGTVQEGGQNKTWTPVKGFTTDQVDHAIAANTLQTMRDDGKAVIILGAKGHRFETQPLRRARAYSSKGSKAFYDHVYDNYNVVDHFTVSGGLYSRQGAGFPVDVIVIDGKGKSTHPRPWNVNEGGVPKIYNSWEELRDEKLLVEPRKSRPGGESPGGQDQTGVGGVPGTSSETGEGAPGASTTVRGGVVDEDGGRGVSRRRRRRPRPKRPVPGDAGTGTPASEGELPDGGEPGGDDRPDGGDSGSSGLAGESPADAGQVSIDITQMSADQIEAFMLWQAGLGPKPDFLEPSQPKKSRKKRPAPKTVRIGKNAILGQNIILEGRRLDDKKDKKDKKDRRDKKDDTTLEEKAAEKWAEADAAAEEFMRLARGSMLSTMGGVDPRLVAAALKMTAKYITAGAYSLAAVVERMAASFGKDAVLVVAPHLEKAWDTLQKADKSGKLSPVQSVKTILEPEKKELTSNEFQVPYQPKSKKQSLETLVPRQHADAVQKALDAIEERYGDIDKFVADELGMTSEQLEQAFGAEQVDALAMAIANHKGRWGFILGDQTGIGKGRVVAGMIRYARRQGLVPIFVTEKPDLYSDMIRDLTEIGVNTPENPFEILATNDLTGQSTVTLFDGRELKQTGKQAEKMFSEAVKNVLQGKGLTATRDGESVTFGAVFTTYNQLQTVKGQHPWRHGAVMQLAPRAFFLLDESHNAGGTEGQGTRTNAQAFSRSRFVREAIAEADGVLYSSATFAKRPGVMGLYARTGLKLAADPHDLPDLIAKGGNPLQQVVSEMLVEAGQYLRRERSYDGVELTPQTVEIDLGGADKASAIFRAINQFDRAKADVVSGLDPDVISGGGTIIRDPSTGDAGVSSTTFSSILWNLVDQMLLAMKADVAADAAIDAFKNQNQTPVIAVDNTLEAALGYYLEENPAQVDDKIEFTFQSMLHRYLERSREITVQPDTRDKSTWYTHYLTDDELGEPALSLYNAANELIEAFDVKMPASPIDWIRHRLEKAGLRVAEITGRTTTVNYSDDGSMTLGLRPEEELKSAGKIATIRKVNNGELDVVILNRSGSTGVSMHASLKNPPAGQRERHMIIAQAAKNVDEFMQMLGRVHRTGQRVPPKYTLLFTNVPAEGRPAAVLVKKLASLNANVTAASKGAMTFDAPDLMNVIGNGVVAQYLADNVDINQELNYPYRPGSGEIPDNLAAKVTGRMSLLPVATQEVFWREVTQAYNARIEELDKLNANPLVAKTLPLEARTDDRMVIFDGNPDSDSPFAQPAYLETVYAARLGVSLSPEEVRAAVNETLKGKDRYDWSDDLVDSLRPKVAEYQRQSVAKLVHQEAIDNKVASIDTQFKTVASAIREFMPGTPVTYDSDFGPIQGVVVDVRQDRNTSNPVTPSSWIVEMAIADASRVVKLPLSRVNPNPMERTLERRTGTLDEALKEFAHASAQIREKRYIATGNLLAAYETLQKERGQITFFTDDQGKVRRGILMPKAFDADRWAANRPLVFRTPTEALEHVQNGGILYSTDGQLMVMLLRGELVLRAAKAKSRGGKYHQNKEILAAAAPEEFNSTGQVMELVVDKSKAMPVLEAVFKITNLQNKSGQESAANTKGGPKKKMGRGPNAAQTMSTTVRDPNWKDDPIAAQDILRTWERLFGVPFGIGRFRTKQSGQRVPGIYKYFPEIARLAEDYMTNLAVAAHEIAHHIDNKNGLWDPLTSAPLKVPGHASQDVAGMDYDPNRADPAEGFAEYLRTWITEPEVTHGGQKMSPAELAAPAFHQWFHQTFLPANPELRAKIEEARKDALRYANQPVLHRASTLIAERVGQDMDWSARWKKQLNGIKAKAITGYQNRFYGLKVADTFARKRGWHGISVEDTAMMYSMSEFSNASLAMKFGVHDIRHGTGAKLGKVTLEGLARHLKTDEEVGEAKWFAHARHTIFMSKMEPEYNTGMDLEQAKAIVADVSADLDKHRRFEAFSKELAQFNNDVALMLVRAGHLSQDDYRAMVKYYGDNYLPLLRVHDRVRGDGANPGFVNLPKGFRKRSHRGSGRPIIDPVEATVRKTIQAYRIAGQARVAIKLAEMLDPMLGGVKGAGGLMDRVDPARVVHEGKVEEILKTLVDNKIVTEDLAKKMRIAAKILAGENMRQSTLEWFANQYNIDLTKPNASKLLFAAAKRVPNILTEIQLWRSDYSPDNAKRIVRIVHNGTPIMYQMDPVLYEAATQNAAMAHVYGPLMKAAMAMSRTFKGLAVGVNPAFAVSNFIADFQEYQGKANVKNLESISKPIGHLIAYTAHHFGKTGDQEALYNEYEALAGKLYSILGADRASNKRAVKRMLGKTKWSRLGLEFKDGSAFGHLWDAAANSVDVVAETLAVSDAPSRLAEAEAVITRYGFEARGGRWFNVHTQKYVDGLPEDVRIEAARAMGAATVNFKKFGTKRAYLEAFLPFSNAAIQAMARQIEQIQNLRNINRKTSGQLSLEALSARRLIVYYSAIAANTLLFWLLRRDDDDYREQEPWLRDYYWTFGWNGKTYIRIKKPRNDAVFSNIILAMLDTFAGSEKDSRGLGEMLGDEVLGRLPVGGGATRGAFEILRNYDYFRGRELTPYWMQDEPTELQINSDTDALSIMLSETLGKHIGMSPIRIRHLMDQATAGWYGDVNRWATGDVGVGDIPFVSGIGMNRHQAASINEFYERQKEVKQQRSLEKAHGKVSAETAREFNRLDQFASLMADIRALEPKRGKRRSFQYQPMLAGLARAALGKDPLVNNPDPFYAEDLPQDVRETLDKFVDSRVETAVLSHGLPEKVHEGDANYAETLSNWKARRAAHEAWLREHKDSPVVQAALDRVRKKKAFVDIVTWNGHAQGQLSKRGREESLEDYRARFNAFRTKRDQAVKWLGESID